MNLFFVPIPIRRSPELRRASGRAALELFTATNTTNAMGNLHVELHVSKGRVGPIAVRTRVAELFMYSADMGYK